MNLSALNFTSFFLPIITSIARSSSIHHGWSFSQLFWVIVPSANSVSSLFTFLFFIPIAYMLNSTDLCGDFSDDRPLLWKLTIFFLHPALYCQPAIYRGEGIAFCPSTSYLLKDSWGWTPVNDLWKPKQVISPAFPVFSYLWIALENFSIWFCTFRSWLLFQNPCQLLKMHHSYPYHTNFIIC